MKTAIIGTGISGLVCAHHLHNECDITLFEGNNYIGGHTNTVTVESSKGPLDVDTGFIVFNTRTYTNYVKLIDELGVEWLETNMGFSVSDQQRDFEYSGESLNGFFAQRRRIFDPGMYRLAWEINRFNRESKKLLENPDYSISLDTYLKENRYSKRFTDDFILPIGAAIWSSSVQSMRDFPALFFIQFFANHGFLDLHDRVVWRVIKGGSRNYVKKLIKPFKDKIRLNSRVQEVRREGGKVQITVNGQVEEFDHVIFACHSDQALSLLHKPNDMEAKTLGKIPYQKNRAVLHTDTNLLPKNRRAWTSWNFMKGHDDSLCVSYNMNILQSLDVDETYIVTLNPGHIQEDKIIREIEYSHPLFTKDVYDAQQNLDAINSSGNTWFCGAYWRYGFHEDGVWSAIQVVDKLKKEAIHA